MNTSCWGRFLAVCLGLTSILTPASGQQTEKKVLPRLTTAEVQKVEHLYKKTPQGDLVLHGFLPQGWKKSDRRPVIIFFFGGAWRNGSYTQFVPQAEYFASRGLVAFSADYRIQSRHQTTPDKCVEDAKSAIRWLRSRAPELGIDPEKVIASGGSAGGHLAAATALVEGFDAKEDNLKASCKPDALVLFNPALNLKTRAILDADGKDIARAISPTLFLKKRTPPAIVFFGTKDPMLEQGREFLAKSRELDNRAELWTAADMPHGFFNRSPWLEVTTRQADDFLRSLGYLSGPPTIQLPAQAPALKREEARAAARDPEPRRPNVIVIITDDQRWDCLGCAGHPHLKTPHIDRLAREGIHFRNAFCTTSLCSPSRASILSGLYAHRHKVVNNFTEYPNDLASFPRQLQGAGYETAYVGKWHMGEDNDAKRPGFDWFVTHKGQGKYWDTEFNVDGERAVKKGYYTHVVTGLAIDWLKRPRQKPFLLMLGHKAPHSFYVAEPKYAHRFDDVKIDYPKSAFRLDDKPAWFKTRLGTWHGIHGPLFDFRKKFPDSRPEAVADFAAMTRAYWGTIQSVDDSVGQIHRALQDLGQLDRTLIVFVSDNGLLNGEHGMVDKRTMHEPSIRVPMVVRYPGLTPTDRPRVVDRMVLHVDLAPSILDICGVEAMPGIHGRSWKKLAQGDPTGWRTSWFYEYDYEKQFPYTPNVRGVRTDEWKYIRYPHGDGSPDRHMAELYHLAADPEEQRNLIGDPAHAGKVKELQAELARRMKEVGLERDTMPLDQGIKNELPDLKIR